jgi:hypothetical protein
VQELSDDLDFCDDLVAPNGESTLPSEPSGVKLGFVTRA